MSLTHKFILLFLIVSSVFSIQPIHSQEIKSLSEQIGIKFGSPLQHIYDNNYRQLYIDQTNVATIMTYWKYTTHMNENVYTWGESDAAVALAEQMGADMHGHPLVWGSDTHIPNWVFNKPYNQAEAIMLDHIETVVNRYAGKIQVWDVVNEAIEDDGTYRDSYWNRAMTGEFIIKAFQKVKELDPSILSIYNDYGMDNNRPKFDQIKNLLGWLQYENAGVAGLGWQVHVHVNEVLDNAYPLASYMQEVSDLGLKNYVTELDIRIDNNSPQELEKQKQAYKKITQIYLNNPTRGEYFQTWGLSDLYTWWNDFDPSQTHYPLPFDANMQKKSAYWGIVEAMTEYLGPPANASEYRIRNVGKNLQLSQTTEDNGANVNLQNLNLDWYSQRWNISDGPDGSSRLSCKWNNQYLQSDDTANGTSTTVHPLNQSWWSMMWFLEPVSGNTYRIKNRWSNTYLTAQSNLDVVINAFNPNSSDQLWILEDVDGDIVEDCPEGHTVNYAVGNGQSEIIRASDWIKANDDVMDGGNLNMKAGNEVEFTAGFDARSGAQILADIDDCDPDDPPPPNSLLSNPNSNSFTNQTYTFLRTFKENPNQCLILGQNLGWSFEMYNQTVAALQNQTGQWPGIIGGQMRYTSSEINYPALVNLYASWQSNGGICELAMLPDNPWTGGSIWDRSQTNISQLTTPGAPGYDSWRAQLDFYAEVLLDMQEAGVTILFRPLMEMNGDWFWYGSNTGQNNQQAYIDLYRDIHDYYTNVKQLNNLIWVYAPSMAYQGIPNVDYYYPGEGYVDITGLSVYENGLALPTSQYQTMVNLGKPFAFTEMGPNHNNMNGSHNYEDYVNIIINNYPEAIYAHAWHDWPGHLVAWISNQNTNQAMNIPCVVGRSEIGF